VRDVPGGGRGILSAWDPATQTERWFRPGGGQSGGGVVSTASNLLFQTTPQGRLLVYTADNGEKLLDIDSGQTGGIGPPMTYMVGGRQYVAFMAGRGIVVGGFNLPPPPAEVTAAAAAPPPPPPAPASGAVLPRVYVYALPE
jgi:hypothetical protein